MNNAADSKNIASPVKTETARHHRISGKLICVCRNEFFGRVKRRGRSVSDESKTPRAPKIKQRAEQNRNYTDVTKAGQIERKDFGT